MRRGSIICYPNSVFGFSIVNLPSYSVRHLRFSTFVLESVFKLPTRYGLVIYAYLLMLANPVRRGAQLRFLPIEKGIILACDRLQYAEYLFFYEPSRLSLYLRPNGIKRRLGEVKDKYMHNLVSVEAGDVVVEVGANIGEFSLAVSHVASSVYSFEPDPIAFRCLRMNVLYSNNIYVRQEALADQAGEAVLFQASSTADTSLIQPLVKSVPLKICTNTIENFMVEVGLELIDFLKVEAEGAEPEILQGALNAIKNNKIRKVSVDCSPERHGKDTLDSCANILSEAGLIVDVNGWMLYAFNQLLCPHHP